MGDREFYVDPLHLREFYRNVRSRFPDGMYTPDRSIRYQATDNTVFVYNNFVYFEDMLEESLVSEDVSIPRLIYMESGHPRIKCRYNGVTLYMNYLGKETERQHIFEAIMQYKDSPGLSSLLLDNVPGEFLSDPKITYWEDGVMVGMGEVFFTTYI